MRTRHRTKLTCSGLFQQTAGSWRPLKVRVLCLDPANMCRANMAWGSSAGGCSLKPSPWSCLNAPCDLVLWVQGEHGTGRNVAPYVEMEWGSTAYELMWQLKELFDPNYVLNPGVILNSVSSLLEQRPACADVLHDHLLASLYDGVPGTWVPDAAGVALSRLSLALLLLMQQNWTWGACTLPAPTLQQKGGVCILTAKAVVSYQSSCVAPVARLDGTAACFAGP